MTRLNLQLNGPDKAVNFAQGFPDFNTDARILEAAANALRDGYNQYATRGALLSSAGRWRRSSPRRGGAAWTRTRR